jgi:hypothetical protein
MKTLKNKPWHKYSASKNGCVRVSDLTEAQAKNQLCEAMDMITKLTEIALSMRIKMDVVLEKNGYTPF